MDDILNNKDKIEQKITQLEKARSELYDKAVNKANGIANYDRELAKTMLKIKNGFISEFEGVPISGLTNTMIPQIAKGIVYQKAFDKEAGEAIYKAAISIMDAIKAELNGLQSINRHLE